MSEQITKESFIGKPSMSEELVLFIKQQILEGELKPGDRIIETKLAKELGISQTPVREAIRLLSGQGIITIVNNKGPIVRSLDMNDVFEIYSLRSAFESLAIRLAILHASKEDIHKLEDFYNEMTRKLHDDSVESLLKESLHIHQTIIQLSGHSRLINSYESNSFQIRLAMRILGKQSTKLKEVEQHRELIEALLKGDPDEAELIMKRHIYRSYLEFSDFPESVIEKKEQYPWFKEN